MKTLLASLAFFLYADIGLPTTKETIPPISIEELLSFHKESTKTIEKKLFEKSKRWMNASEGYTKSKIIAKGESAWKLGPDGVMDAKLVYSPFADQGDKFVGPLITLTLLSEDEYAALIREAGDIKDLKSCPDSNHKQFWEEFHFSGKDCNILFQEDDDFGTKHYFVQIYGKEKK